MFALCTSQNSQMEALWLSKSQQSPKNQKQRKVFVQKKKKKKLKEERKSAILSRTEKILGESDWYWRSSTLASRFRTKRSPSNQNLSYKKLKPRFPFTHASTNVDTKPTASNRMLRGCLSIRCLASQHISRFFHF